MNDESKSHVYPFISGLLLLPLLAIKMLCSGWCVFHKNSLAMGVFRDLINGNKSNIEISLLLSMFHIK